METTTNATQVATPNGNDTKKNAGAKVENLTYPVMNAKRETMTFIHPDELKNPLVMIGKLCNDYSSKMLLFVDWPKKSVVFTIPAAGTYGAKERALMAHKNYLAAITEGLERNEAITNKETLATLGLYKAKGWKFSTYTKIGILTVVGEKLKEVTTAVNLVKEVTMACPELRKLITDNNLRKEVAAEIKANGLEAGLKLAQSKSLKGLPAIVK